MPIGAQPRGARGTSDRPYSALRLRLVLAVFGVVVCVVGAIICWRPGLVPFALALSLFALIGVVDAIVVIVRLRRGRMPS